MEDKKDALAPAAAQGITPFEGDWSELSAVTPTAERPEGLGTDGLEGIRPDELKLPRLAIAQGLSPQLVPDDASYIKGLVIGEMFNDVTLDIYGSGPVRVVPVKRTVTRIEFDKEDRKRPVDRDVPWHDERMKWHGDEPPAATEFVEFACLALRPGKAPDKVVVSIKTTNKQQREAAKLWTTYVSNRNADIFAGMYELTTKIARGTNKKGEPTMYGHFVVKNLGFIPRSAPAGEALYQLAKTFAEQLKAGFTTNREGEDPDAFEPHKYEWRPDWAPGKGARLQIWDGRPDHREPARVPPRLPLPANSNTRKDER